jgi:hypothetical protein
VFAGDTTYGPSNIQSIILIGSLTPTTITVTASNTTPAVNQSFTLSGTLYKAVPSGPWTQVNTTTTTKGAYSFTRSESSQGTYAYYAVFAGDTVYGPSNTGCSVNVRA